MHLNIYHILNNDVHFVGYFYIMDFIKARKTKLVKMNYESNQQDANI
jgi:hypothetical protein